jgi:hypothetical protein
MSLRIYRSIALAGLFAMADPKFAEVFYYGSAAGRNILPINFRNITSLLYPRGPSVMPPYPEGFTPR